MKNLFSPLTKLVAVAACALALGSCSRAEYAMLPKGASYHGVVRASAPAPKAAAVVATPAPVAETATSEVVSVPAAPATSSVSKVPTPAQVPAVASANVPAVAPVAAIGASNTPAAMRPKLTLGQRMVLNKVIRKVDKLVQRAGTVRQHNNTASTARGGISGNLRTGLIFLLVGLLVSLFSGISYLFAIIGGILAIIGLVFIILWLLDQA